MVTRRKFRNTTPSSKRINNWGEYVDENRRLLVVLENIKKLVENLDNSSDDMFDSTHNFFGDFFREGNTSEMIKNLRNQSHRVKEILEGGGGEDKGLIPIVREEIRDVENYLKNHSPLEPEEAKLVLQLANNFNSKKMRLWENLRAIMGRTQSLGTQLVQYEQQKVSTVAGGLVEKFSNLDKVIRNDGGEENVLMNLLEVLKNLDVFRDSNYGKSLRKNVVLSAKNNYSYELSEDLDLVIGNFLTNYKQPIKERIEKIQNLLNSKGYSYINLDESEKEQVNSIYNEFVSRLFKDTSYELIFKDIKDSNSLSEEKKKFQTLITKLESLIREKYPAIHNESIENIVLISSKHSKIKTKLKDISMNSVIDYKGITYTDLAGIDEKKSKKSSLLSLYKEINNYLEVVVSEEGAFNQFIKIQPYTNPIGKYIKKAEEDKLLQDYWNEWGSSFENMSITIEKNLRQWNELFYKVMPYLDVNKQVLYINFLHLIPGLYEPSGSNYQKLESVYSSIRTEVENLKRELKEREQRSSAALSTLETNKEHLNRIKQEESERIRKIEGEIDEYERRRRERLDSLEKKYDRNLENIDQQIANEREQIKGLRSEKNTLQFPRRSEFNQGRMNYNDELYNERFQQVKNEREELDRQIQEKESKVGNLYEQRRQLEERDFGDDSVLKDLEEKIRTRQNEKETERNFFTVYLPKIDRRTGGVYSDYVAEEVKSSNLDGVLMRVDENLQFLYHIKEVFGNNFGVFSQYGDFLDQVIRFLGMIVGNKELGQRPGFRYFIEEYKKLHEDENLTDTQVWYILNRNFRYSGGEIFQNVRGNGGEIQ